MMSAKRFFIIQFCIVLVILAAAGCASPVKKAYIDFENIDENMHSLKIYSPAMEGNLLGTHPSRNITVYLPPGYDEKSSTKYPVVYYLHGWTDAGFQIIRHNKSFDKYFAANPEKAFIVVAVDASNEFGGTFYTNSPVSGNWETHFIDELIPLIENKYAIDPEKRGIAGFSMGGYGAWELGFKYPTLFSKVQIFSPGAFSETGLKDALKSNCWNNTFKTGYSAAFAPNIADPKKAIVPKLNSSEENKKLLAMWESGFGDIRNKIQAYAEKKKSEQSISIVLGKNDYYKWIVDGTKYLAEILNENNIEHTFDIHNGGHDFNLDIVKEYFLPFFAGF